MFQRSDTVIKTRFGTFDFSCFSFGACEQDNVLVLKRSWSGVPVCRVQSACYTAEIFRSLDCDCHQQLASSLRTIAERGGLLVYMLCDGRGAGIFTKVRALELTRTAGLDTADAYTQLGVPPDPRTYGRVASVLSSLEVSEVELLTNNPRKVHGLEAHGIVVHRSPLEFDATPDSRAYLEAKYLKLGHLFTQFGPATPGGGPRKQGRKPRRR